MRILNRSVFGDIAVGLIFSFVLVACFYFAVMIYVNEEMPYRYSPAPVSSYGENKMQELQLEADREAEVRLQELNAMSDRERMCAIVLEPEN